LDSFSDASLKTTAKSIDSFEQSRYAKFSVQFDNTPGGFIQIYPGSGYEQWP
jgi:hypothetical protein